MSEWSKDVQPVIDTLLEANRSLIVGDIGRASDHITEAVRMLRNPIELREPTPPGGD